MNLKNKILDRMLKVKYIDYVTPSKATGKVASVYRAANKEFGFSADPIVVHSSIPELLEAFYALGRQTLLVRGKVSRVAKEAMIAAISKANECPYCVDAHSLMVHSLHDTQTISAIRSGDFSLIEDQKLRKMVAWAAHSRQPGEGRALLSSVPASALPEMMATALLFHYINRIVNVFVQESQLPKGPMRGIFWQVGSRMMSPYSSRYVRTEPYRESEWLAGDKFHWALPDAPLAFRCTVFDAEIDKLGQRYLPEQIRVLVQEHVNGWQGENMPLGKKWLHEGLSGLDDALKPMATLALLSALASYQIEESLMHVIKEQHGSRVMLVLVCWASWAAALRILEGLTISAEGKV